MGNCTYILAKNCHVDDTLPAFEVVSKNMNEGTVRFPTVDTVTLNVHNITIDIVRFEFGIVRVSQSVVLHCFMFLLYSYCNIHCYIRKKEEKMCQRCISFIFVLI